jgi:hypothetical protein
MTLAGAVAIALLRCPTPPSAAPRFPRLNEVASLSISVVPLDDSDLCDAETEHMCPTENLRHITGDKESMMVKTSGGTDAFVIQL